MPRKPSERLVEIVMELREQDRDACAVAILAAGIGIYLDEVAARKETLAADHA